MDRVGSLEMRSQFSFSLLLSDFVSGEKDVVNTSGAVGFGCLGWCSASVSAMVVLIKSVC